ncbi:MAG TPA: DUF5115 domain-containing protein [Bacteroidales bacterium]|nr:DUF5115 domain-containing protein [Bacteroidales bacterium]
MKNKIYLLASLLAVLFFASCDDVYDHVAEPPQSYEQENEQTVNGFSFTLGSDISNAVIFTEDDLMSETPIRVIETTATPEMAEGATLKFVVEASDTEEFTKTVELPSKSDEDNAVITTAYDLNEVVKSLYGKAPNARDIFLRATFYIVDGTTSSLMPNPVVLGPASVTPVAPIIETEYYLIGDINGWNIENLDDYKFDHSGKDVYEDPIFTILVNNVQGYFKIVPKSSKDAASWEGVMGNPIDGNTDLEGDIIIEDSQAMQVTEPGWVKITLNMMEYTYSIEIIGEMALELYVPGGHQGWDPGSAPSLYNRNFDFKYNGFVYFGEDNTEFKFTTERNWDGPAYGDGGDGTLSSDGGNLVASEAGMYKIDVDLSGSPVYSMVKTEWGLIGDATEGGWDNSTPMTYDPETALWTVTTTLGTGEFKFRANDGWDINLGGDINNLSFGADNIPVTEEGTYEISLDLSDSKQFKGTIVKL